MKVGVYVGSFNPVHKGHIMLVNYLLNNNYVDKVIIIPTKNYWSKQDLIDINKRIDMLKYYESSNIEINQELTDLEYTYLIIRELHKKYNDISLIIGADNLVNFHMWKNIDEILENKVIVIGRDSIDSRKYINKFNSNNFILTDFKEVDISSSYVRNLVNKENYNELEIYLDKDIIKYIIKNKLYR